MASASRLGRLEKVDLRNVWTSESGDFTPWLALDEHIAILGDAIGIELEVEAQEKNVGPFRADILCKDTANGNWVLIENQLARTDHCHLGQLLTYGAGLKALTVVWIAERFTDEHRAALDWLNEITAESFGFFGLEIELWRIGDSAAAPKFNIVSKPNDWAKPTIVAGELTDLRLLQRDYWAALRELLVERGSILKSQKPQPQSWTNFAIGRSNFCLFASITLQKEFIAVGLYLSGPSAKAHFRRLLQEKGVIERESGVALDWQELPDQKDSKVVTFCRNVNPADRQNWPQQHAWMLSMLEIFHRVFSKRVKGLNIEVDESVTEVGTPIEAG
jgi:hypothetical protein